MDSRKYSDEELDAIIIYSIIGKNVIVIDMIECGIDIDEHIEEYFDRVLGVGCFRDKPQMINNYKKFEQALEKGEM